MIDQTAEEIREMQTHSSSVVAINATKSLESLLDREFTSVEAFLRDVEQNGAVLRQANPSHASLQNAVRSVIEQVEDAEPETVEEAKSVTRTAIVDVIARVESAKHRAAENAAEALVDGATLLTHDYSSTVVEALELATEAGKHFDVYVTEARPRYIGRKTVRRLSGVDGIEVTLITDGASGHYLADCDRILVGMDCIVEGVLYNRVGTFPIAAAADHLDVPLTVVGAGTKLITGGFAFENEFRSGVEVMAEPADGFAIENPAYDATPVEFLDTVITDEGVFEP